MLIDLLWNGLYFEKDGGSGDDPPTDDSVGDSDDEEAKAKAKSEDERAGDDGKEKVKDEKQFTQAELNAIVKDRLERERKKNEDTAAKAKKEAEEDALKKNQEWQKLAEDREKEIADLNQKVTDLEAIQETADKYKTALEAQLNGYKANLPKHIVTLIDKMDPVEAMDYITSNAEELGKKFEGYGPTPKEKEKKLSDDDKKEAEDASLGVIRRSF